jgi:hypothetical protein
MSQWSQGQWDLQSSEAAPAWPVAIVVHPAKQKEPRGSCHCLVWMTSQASGTREKGWVEQEHIANPSTSVMGASIRHW